MTRVILEGCTAEPLGAYLKALAIIRLIAEQKDPNAKGWWEDGTFCIESVLDKEGISRFFLEEYMPTPIVAPWGARSGFYPGSPEKTARETIGKLMSSPSPRLKKYNEGVGSVKDLLKRHTLNTKPDSGELTLQLLQWCRSELSDTFLDWLDAVYILSANERTFSQILGTGGNEGSQGFTSTFAQMLKKLDFDSETGLSDGSKGLLISALFGEFSQSLIFSPTGFFYPGCTGGNNQGFGITVPDVPTNPWNFIFTMEGAIIWSSGVGRRDAVERSEIPKSPFTVRVKAIGYSSATPEDENKPLAEIWAPLWQKPLGLSELKAFIGEGRSEVGTKRASNTLEFAEAVSSLGIDRGVTEFVRYDILKRRGKIYIALPSGRFPVTYRRESDLIRQLDPILQKLDNFIRKEFPLVPSEFVSARRRIDHAMYEILLHGEKIQIKYLIAAIGQMEQLLAKRTKTKATGSPPSFFGLSPGWIAAADDGSLEIRIAAALASIRATGKVGSIRANLERGDPKKPDQTAWEGNTFSARLSSVLARRMMDAKRLNCTSNPLDAVISLVPEDVASFIDGDTDDRLVQDLLFGLMWIQWNNCTETMAMATKLRREWNRPVNARIVQRSWALIKLLFLPHNIRKEDREPVKVEPEASVIPLLLAGRIRDACSIARTRLYSSGFLPVKATFPDAGNGERIAAALLIPLRGEKSLMRLVLNEDDL